MSEFEIREHLEHCEMAGIDEEEFDRWLKRHEETIKAVAWDEGARAERTYQWRCEDADAAGQGVMILREPNPYTAPIKEETNE